MRQRHIYPTREIFHLWVHGIDRDIRNHGNVFTEGDTIYSYGHHYPLARRIAVKGGTVILVNPRKVSVTTSQHQSEVWTAALGCVRVWLPVDLWPCVTYRGNGGAIRSYFQCKINTLMKQARNNRCGYWFRNNATREAYELMYRYRDLHDLMKFRVKNTVTMGDMPDLEPVRLRDAERDTRRREKLDRQYAEKVARIAIEEGPVEDRIARWQAGETGIYRGDFPSDHLMRVKDGYVETTGGARVSVEAVKDFINGSLQIVKHEGDCPDMMCGPYRGVWVTDEALHIGCHRFTWAEVNRMVDLLNKENGDDS